MGGARIRPLTSSLFSGARFALPGVYMDLGSVVRRGMGRLKAETGTNPTEMRPEPVNILLKGRSSATGRKTRVGGLQKIGHTGPKSCKSSHGGRPDVALGETVGAWPRTGPGYRLQGHVAHLSKVVAVDVFVNVASPV